MHELVFWLLRVFVRICRCDSIASVLALWSSGGRFLAGLWIDDFVSWLLLGHDLSVKISKPYFSHRPAGAEILNALTYLVIRHDFVCGCLESLRSLHSCIAIIRLVCPINFVSGEFCATNGLVILVAHHAGISRNTLLY